MSLDPTSKIAEKLIHSAMKPAQGKPIPGATCVSAVIITHNHEKVIDRCLKSLRWVDELVIVDLGSTDNTLTLVKEYPCQIYYYPTHPWTHEGFPLNFGCSMAQNQWILHLKPHEWLETQIKEEIHAFLQQPSPSFQGVQFSLEHFYQGHSDFSGKSILLPSSPQTRLFKKEAGMASPPNCLNPIQVEGMLITGANAICSEPYDTLDDLFQAVQTQSTRSASLLLEKDFPKPMLTHWSNLLLRPLFTFLKFHFLYGKQQDAGFTRTLAMAQSTYVFQKYEKLRQWAQAL